MVPQLSGPIEGLEPRRHDADVEHDDLEQPVWEPADHVDRYHGQYHASHLASRLLLA